MNKVEQLVREVIKNVQSRFFRDNLNAQRGFFITKEEADDLRKKITRPFKSKKYKKHLKKHE